MDSVIEHLMSQLDLKEISQRYVCGGEALTSLRSVSRMRLVLAEENIVNDDIQAQLLLRTIQNYHRAKKILTESCTRGISISGLIKAHGEIEPNNPKFGILRSNEMWIGKTKETAIYVAPPPKDVPELLTIWKSKFDALPRSKDSVFSAFSNLLSIHPFIDGNGRIASAFLEVFLSQINRSISIFNLYRLGRDYTDMNHAMHQLNWIKRSELHFTNYWSEAVDWCESLEQKASDIWKHTVDDIYSRFAMQRVTHADQTVINQLLAAPAFDPVKLQIKFGLPQALLAQSLKKLSDIGVVEAGKSGNIRFYYSKIVFNGLNAIENAFYQGKTTNKMEKT